MLIFGDRKPATHKPSCLEWIKATNSLGKRLKEVIGDRGSSIEEILEELPSLQWLSDEFASALWVGDKVTKSLALFDWCVVFPDAWLVAYINIEFK